MTQKGGSTEILGCAVFDGLRNAEFNALKTDIFNQALQEKYAVSRTYDKVTKLAGG